MASLLTGEPSHHRGGGHWYLSRKEIEENSPSRRDGISLKKEKYLRKSYSIFLRNLGIDLKVPQVTISTAVVFCHRFFLHQSHAKNDWTIIAIACMFLAGKVEETPRLLKDVILLAYKIIHINNAEVVERIRQKEVFEKKKELILMAERVVLVTLGFDFNILHPYRPLIQVIKKFKVAQKALAQIAWNFVNDGLRTTLSLQFQPHQIAACAVFLAAMYLEVKLPSNGERAWWQEFGVTTRQLEEYSNQMLELYEQHRVPPFQASESEGSAGGGRPTLKVPSLNPTPSRPGPDEQHTDNGETQNKTEFGIEDNQNGNCARIEPSYAEESKDKCHGRNLSKKDVTVGQSPQDATKKLDREKLKAAFARRKASRDTARKAEPVDELVRELEDVEVLGDSKKTNHKQNQSCPDSDDVKYGNEARDAHCLAMKGQSLHGDDSDIVEEGEVEPSDEADGGYQAPMSSRKRKPASPLDWNGYLERDHKRHLQETSLKCIN